MLGNLILLRCLLKYCVFCLVGIPDEAGIRSKAWMVLLGYLPADKRRWKHVLSEQRKSYYVSEQ
jgi:hypothetical protein